MKKFGDMKSRFLGIHDLMKFRVTEILLISTEYDAYVLEYIELGIAERIVEPERQFIFRVPWMDDIGRVRVN